MSKINFQSFVRVTDPGVPLEKLEEIVGHVSALSKQPSHREDKNIGLREIIVLTQSDTKKPVQNYVVVDYKKIGRAHV